MLTVVSAHSPVYSAEDQQGVSLMVKFEEFNEELPFTATSHDPMSYGVELYNRAISGEFGPIADFVGIKQADPSQPQPTVDGAQSL